MGAWEGVLPDRQPTTASLFVSRVTSCPIPVPRAARRSLSSAPHFRGGHRVGRARGRGAEAGTRGRGAVGGGPSAYLDCWQRPAGSPTTRLPDRLPSPRGPDASWQVGEGSGGGGGGDPLSLTARDSHSARGGVAERGGRRPEEMTSQTPRPSSCRSQRCRSFHAGSGGLDRPGKAK